MNDQRVYKVKQLVEACLDTKNYVKLAATTLMLLRNTVISQARSLQIPLKSDAYIYEIMFQVNHLLSLESSVSPYKESMITRIKLIENLMKKGKGKIPLRFIKEAIEIYFDLQQVSIPPRESMIDASTGTSFKGFFSRFNKLEKESPILQIIEHELSTRERSLRSRVDAGENEKAIMDLQRISNLRNSLTNNRSKKIRVNDPISMNQKYLLFLAQSKAYPLLGIFFLLVTLSLLVLVQITLNFDLLAPLGTFFLMFGGGAALSLYLYTLTRRKGANLTW